MEAVLDALWKSTPNSSEAAVGVTIVSVVDVEVAGAVDEVVAVEEATSDDFWILPSGPMMGAGELPCDQRDTPLRCDPNEEEEDCDARAGKARSPVDIRDLAWK